MSYSKIQPNFNQKSISGESDPQKRRNIKLNVPAYKCLFAVVGSKQKKWGKCLAKKPKRSAGKPKRKQIKTCVCPGAEIVEFMPYVNIFLNHDQKDEKITILAVCSVTETQGENIFPLPEK
jgi:hypothetical protein